VSPKQHSSKSSGWNQIFSNLFQQSDLYFRIQFLFFSIGKFIRDVLKLEKRLRMSFAKDLVKMFQKICLILTSLFTPILHNFFNTVQVTDSYFKPIKLRNNP